MILRNRAKCKLCNSIIESFHPNDYVTCKCGEIAVNGGPGNYKCYAEDYVNFLRVDDDGNQLIVTVQGKACTSEEEAQSLKQSDTRNPSKPTKEDLLKMLDEMVKSYENLPKNAMCSNPTQYDIYSALLLISALFRAQA